MRMIQSCFLGPSPSESKGTRSVFGFPWRLGGKGRWKVELVESCSSSFTMGITSPADACVGSYKLSIRLGSENAIPRQLTNLVLLFNPWCAGIHFTLGRIVRNIVCLLYI